MIADSFSRPSALRSEGRRDSALSRIWNRLRAARQAAPVENASLTEWAPLHRRASAAGVPVELSVVLSVVHITMQRKFFVRAGALSQSTPGEEHG
jgi:hypothetical protein